MIPDRARVKRILLEDRRRWGGQFRRCEGVAWHDVDPHVCDPALDLNEVIFPRNVFQKLTKAKQRHFWHPINCAINCRKFHKQHGHTPGYVRWHVQRVIDIYGRDLVEHYIRQAPLKLKPEIAWLEA